MLEVLKKDLHVNNPTEETIGLSSEEAFELLSAHGENRLSAKNKNSVLKIFAGQFHDVMVMILLVATVISVLLGEYADAIPIMIIVVVNAILGFIQEYRCEKTLEKLEAMTAPNAKVYRDGKLSVIPASQIVVGDVFEVEAGDRIPCDGFILSAKSLTCDESILTGEALPAEKVARTTQVDFSNLNLTYMGYMGSVATKGWGRLQAVATGERSQMGKVSKMLENIYSEQTPLQKKLGELGRTLAIICLGVCIIVFLAGVIRGEPVFDMLMTGITIAIAAIPEGLPATVTIALAMAVRKMLKRKALVHKLHSVETLGCTTVICTDKTGTLTMNKMTVTHAYTLSNDEAEYIFPKDKGSDGVINSDGKLIMAWDNAVLNEMLICGAVCNNARFSVSSPASGRNRNGLVSKYQAIGDPTEAAILTASARAGIDSKNIQLKRIDEQPFDSDTKFMSVICTDSEGEQITYKKGAPDVIIKSCGYKLSDSSEELAPLTARDRQLIMKKNDSMANSGLRVLGFCEIRNDKSVFLGLMGMADPPRAEAKRSVRLCKKAGIKTVMITGDHKLTASVIAKEVGIMQEGDLCITGNELDNMTDEQLCEIIDKTAVYARVSPAHKLRIIKAFKAKGNVCAMTGDGVNDAPAIKESSIGVSMGVSGTDVTKQAADVILLDDNFATLVNAVEEGRTIYQNIRKFVRYLISCNIGEVLTMFGGIIMGLPIVLVPAQILLVNLVTDGLPAVALGLEPGEKSVMQRPPRKESDSFFKGGLLTRIVIRGILIGLCTLASFTCLLKMGYTLPQARTGAMITLIVSQLIHVFECKSEEKTLFSVPFFSNPFMLFAVAVSIICLLLCIYIPFLSGVFALVRPGPTMWLVSVGFSFAVPIFSGIFSKLSI
ncbi:MAG: cation-translocating P-type ATPase [Ruminococcus sp.]|nr:cation-translocating P-type ATPase [Ruminococcus sp.]